ncbi:unnamed protein product [Camellia sinensis]
MADSPILGLVEVGGGRIAVYGDSNCLDSSHMVTNCYWLLKKILDFTSKNIKDPFLLSDSVRKDKPLYHDDKQLPSCRTDVNFSTYSAVVRKELICGSDSRVEVGGPKGYGLLVRGRDRRLPGYPVIDLGRGLNSTTEDSRIKRSNSAEKNEDECLRNKYLAGLLNRDDERNNFFFVVDMPMVIASHWLVPAIARFLVS